MVFPSSTLVAGGGTVLVNVCFVEFFEGLVTGDSLDAGATAGVGGMTDFEDTSGFAAVIRGTGLG